MNIYKNEAVKMVLLSVAFTLILIMVRMAFTKQFTYLFLMWNLFLAAVPVLFSQLLLKKNKMKFKAVLLLILWLLFFPNAPYIITDFFHFKERPPIPKWFDLLIITCAAWNGLILGIISLLQVEAFLSRHVSKLKVNVIISSSFLLCGFGIYLGRFLRFNSWDIITDPGSLFTALKYRVFYPHENLRTWGFTFLFGAMLWLFYYTIKKLSGLKLNINQA